MTSETEGWAIKGPSCLDMVTVLDPQNLRQPRRTPHPPKKHEHTLDPHDRATVSPMVGHWGLQKGTGGSPIPSSSPLLRSEPVGRADSQHRLSWLPRLNGQNLLIQVGGEDGADRSGVQISSSGDSCEVHKMINNGDVCHRDT